MDRDNLIRYDFQEVDHHDRPVQRSRIAHPYGYSLHMRWRAGTNEEITDDTWTDRLFQLDNEKYNRLRQKHFGNKAQTSWSSDDPVKVEAFLQDYMERPDLRIILLMEGCNVATGFPVWRISYNLPEKDVAEDANCKDVPPCG